MPNCFVIMPITTPEAVLPQYGNDSDHFIHVLEHLFGPAVSEAGLTTIEPIAKGADVIQARIIKHLESAELVLCDISTLNPNVFFELGCRTALNKPVCYVKDDLTRRIPFDTGIINHHTYLSSLAPWTLKQEIMALATHIRSSLERSANRNMLWEYFGLQTSAHPAPARGSEGERLEYLIMQVEGLKKSVQEQESRAPETTSSGYTGGSANVARTTIFVDDWIKTLESARNELDLLQRLARTDPEYAESSYSTYRIQSQYDNLTTLMEKLPPKSSEAAEVRRLLDGFRKLQQTKAKSVGR